MNLSNKSSYRYKDVVLLPKSNSVKSRKDVPIEGWRIITSPMSSIVGEEFIKAVQKLDKDIRPTICIPKQLEEEQRLDLIMLCATLQLYPFVAVGINDYESVLRLSKDCDYPLLLDTANGYLNTVLDEVKFLNNYWTSTSIMAGNVVTKDGAEALAKAGATHIRVGIGNGSVCSTKFAAGYHRGQVTAIDDARLFYISVDPDVGKGIPPYVIVADGGIEYPGDAVKAFGAGAHYVMIGSLFAECEEAETHVTGEHAYWGQASEREKSEYVEGFYEPISSKHPLGEFLHHLWEGIQSGVSYSGYSTVNDFIGNGVFEVKGR